MSFGKMPYTAPSRFLDEISPTHLQQGVPVSGKVVKEVNTGPQRARIVGNFKRKTAKPTFRVDPANFKPSPSSSIQVGMNVLHLKFGEGKVLSIDGNNCWMECYIMIKPIMNKYALEKMELSKLI